jgi:hypothetical protein
MVLAVHLLLTNAQKAQPDSIGQHLGQAAAEWNGGGQPEHGGHAVSSAAACHVRLHALQVQD